MILYFADRELNIIGQASTKLPEGLLVMEDLKTEDIETGIAVFECKIPYDSTIREQVEACTEVGNYLLRSFQGENELYTITETELDTKKQVVSLYAEDAGLDLLGDVFGSYEADKAYPITHYISKFAAGSGFQVGINEAGSLARKLSWDGEATAAERIRSAAEQFDGCEVSYSFEIKGLSVTKKYINIYRERGKDLGIQLRLNYEVDSIVTTKTIDNLATALQCTGGTPENAENPITLKGYQYDDGDFYVDGAQLKSRKALSRWRRYLWRDDGAGQAGGHIVRLYSYDTTSQKELCAHAVTELKKLRDMEVNYEVSITRLPENVRIGDRVNIVDDAGGLYLSSRLLALSVSVSGQSQKATLGEHLIKGSGIAQKVLDLAEQFSKNSLSAQRALALANNAKAAAEQAQETADTALTGAQEAAETAQAAAQTADAAAGSAQTAQAAAGAAQAAVDAVEESVSSIQTTVENAQAAADNAWQAAQTAQTKAEQAAAAADNAQTAAETAQTTAGSAKTAADSASANASLAVSTANTAKTQAEDAQATATAAKADAAQAVRDIAALGEGLETVTTTMTTDYARKTDLTEAAASLQTQISQNAAGISLTAKKLSDLDETVNDAAQQAALAQQTAQTAQAQADQAQADAQAAQAQADQARVAADSAQAEADTAARAAEEAQNTADRAAGDLEAANEDLQTVLDRADATEEEIAAAREAVAAAQQASDAAAAEAETALSQAQAAQAVADTAAEQANTAQAQASTAAQDAALAQKLVDEANGSAAASVAALAAALSVAAAKTARETASDAVQTAAGAQAAANQAAETAQTARTSAEEAGARADQAETDLTAAEQALEDVLSQVGATQEEIEAAQAAVEAAQTAAAQARQEADEAQADADQAEAEAVTAQAAADKAQADADKAQAAAAQAQQAADQAQAAVDALETRVTDSETRISQNAEKLLLAATKTEVSETLGGYYTKEETDAAISLEADQITFSVAEVRTLADDAGTRITSAETSLQLLQDSLSTLVRDENGESLMEQDGGGWTFSMKPTKEKLDQLQDGLGGLETDVGAVQGSLSNISSDLEELNDKTSYITVSSDETKPFIELGQSQSDFKLRITNTEIQFMDGTAVPAYVSNQKLMIEQAEVKDELHFGSFIWKIRDNQNMGLVWQEAERLAGTASAQLSLYKQPNESAGIVAAVESGAALWIDSSTLENAWLKAYTESGAGGFCRRELVTIPQE